MFLFQEAFNKTLSKINKVMELKFEIKIPYMHKPFLGFYINPPK